MVRGLGWANDAWGVLMNSTEARVIAFRAIRDSLNGVDSQWMQCNRLLLKAIECSSFELHLVFSWYGKLI